MKPARPSADSAGTMGGLVDAIGPHAEVPPDRYDEIARQHVAANGGQGVVIDPHRTPQQWRAWLAYFAWLDDQPPRGRKAPTMRMLKNGATVPTEWPLAFDLNAPSAPLFDPYGQSSAPEAPLERRRQIGAMLRHAVAGVAMPGQRRPLPDARYGAPSQAAEARAVHERSLEELARLPPVALSASLAAKFKPAGPEDAWPGPPPPEPLPEPAWRRSEEIYDTDEDEVRF
jgi:hypothetical protein